MKNKTISHVQYVEIADDAGQRVDNFLFRFLKTVPRTRIYRMLRKGEVRANGGRIRPTYRLKKGDLIRIPPIFLGPTREAPLISQELAKQIEHSIIYEDDYLIVLNKPQDLAVHGGGGVSHGVIERLRFSRDMTQLELAHRIDKATSGCLLVAKSRPVLREIHAALRDRNIEKRYSLIVSGRWNPKVKTIRQSLYRFVLPSGERRVRVSPDGKASRTDFEVLKVGNRATWLYAFPRTGRTHQIRVHALWAGHPILGDEK